jgi:hypothetical protein
MRSPAEVADIECGDMKAGTAVVGRLIYRIAPPSVVDGSSSSTSSMRGVVIIQMVWAATAVHGLAAHSS